MAVAVAVLAALVTVLVLVRIVKVPLVQGSRSLPS